MEAGTEAASEEEAWVEAETVRAGSARAVAEGSAPVKESVASGLVGMVVASAAVRAAAAATVRENQARVAEAVTGPGYQARVVVVAMAPEGWAGR